jgi:hypothetical protein
MNIDTIRGDTLNIQFEIEADTVLDLDDNDFQITFSLKQAATDTAYVFQKDKTAVVSPSDNVFILRIAPEDTTELVPGYYYYDIQLNIGDDIYTIAIGKLHLEIDITRPPAVLPVFPYPDINNDGIVNSIDASMVLTAYMNLVDGNPSGLTPEQENLADCNRDGFINSKDASLLMAYVSDCAAGLYTNDQAGWTTYMTEHYVEPQG